MSTAVFQPGYRLTGRDSLPTHILQGYIKFLIEFAEDANLISKGGHTGEEQTDLSIASWLPPLNCAQLQGTVHTRQTNGHSCHDSTLLYAGFSLFSRRTYIATYLPLDLNMMAARVHLQPGCKQYLGLDASEWNLCFQVSRVLRNLILH